MPLSVHETRGDDIAGRETYAELRAHYLVWRNELDGLDFVGFQHYRRWLRLDRLGKDSSRPHVDDPDVFRRYTARAQLPDLANYDVIAASKWWFRRPIGEEYRAAHTAAHWDALLEEWPEAAFLSHDEMAYNPCNIFVMRAPIFGHYMTFWWDLTRRIEASVAIPSDPYQRRAVAFLSERIFSLWLKRERPSLMVWECPLVMDTSL